MSTKSKRKFYRSVIQIEVLSEEPYSSTDLEKVLDDITNGHQSGDVSLVVDSEEMDSKTCADKLKAQGSTPDFFMLDDHGHDIKEEGGHDWLGLEDDEDDDKVIKKLKKD
ncbi:MAG TPA: hypothetical protein VNX68_13235 [Nitrosopumilaceae archaeon]|jgi:hypothetical protein|nr:hypothetical protein [Nitrosopumilaceae archaeon]